MILPTLFFFLKIAEAICNLLWFHINFGAVYSSFVKYTIGIFTGIALNLWIALGRMDILMLIFPVYKQGVCFLLSVSSSISFFSVL